MSNTRTPSYLPYDDYAQSANALFHFMKERDYLVTALKNSALMPRYCVETVDYLDLHGNGYFFKKVAILQKCFCDIPFHKLGENFSIEVVDEDYKDLSEDEKEQFKNNNTHFDYYGKFAIVFYKRWGEENNLQPVHYLNKDSQYRKDFSCLFEYIMAQDDVPSEYVQDVLNRLSYFKPLRGVMKRVSESSGHEVNCLKNFHDECEWRYVPSPSIMSALHMDNVIASESMIQECNAINTGLASEEYHKIWLRFSYNDIKYIIVPDDNERRKVIEIIMNLPRVCFKTIKVTKQGYRQGKQRHENKAPFSHTGLKNDGDF